MAFDNLLRILRDNNYQILQIEDKVHIRKKDSGKHKKGDLDSFKVIICKCPTEGCNGIIKLERERDLLKRKCRRCSVVGSKRKDKRVRVWEVLTTDINEATTFLAKSNPDLFLREEGTLTTKNGLAKRVILKCSTKNCDGTISTNFTNRSIPKHSRCRKCGDEAKKKRPFERSYNRAKKRKERVKKNGLSIKWLLTYEEFVFLCQIPTCHYCNKPLNRAEYKSEKGATSLLIDRKDSNKDYTLDNCVPCCPDCNFTKNERISYDEMVLIMKHRKLWVEKREI
jgi:hypothetical protein